MFGPLLRLKDNLSNELEGSRARAGLTRRPPAQDREKVIYQDRVVYQDRIGASRPPTPLPGGIVPGAPRGLEGGVSATMTT